MPTNQTLTPEEKENTIMDALGWAATIIHNALTYVGAKAIKLSGTVTGPDGLQYTIDFKPKEPTCTEEQSVAPSHQ